MTTTKKRKLPMSRLTHPRPLVLLPLVSVSRAITIAGRLLRVLPLETIVALKRNSTDPKDKLRLPVLEAALRHQNQDS